MEDSPLHRFLLEQQATVEAVSVPESATLNYFSPPPLPHPSSFDNDHREPEEIERSSLVLNDEWMKTVGELWVRHQSQSIPQRIALKLLGAKFLANNLLPITSTLVESTPAAIWTPIRALWGAKLFSTHSYKKITVESRLDGRQEQGGEGKDSSWIRALSVLALALVLGQMAWVGNGSGGQVGTLLMTSIVLVVVFSVLMMVRRVCEKEIRADAKAELMEFTSVCASIMNHGFEPWDRALGRALSALTSQRVLTSQSIDSTVASTLSTALLQCCVLMNPAFEVPSQTPGTLGHLRALRTCYLNERVIWATRIVKKWRFLTRFDVIGKCGWGLAVVGAARAHAQICRELQALLMSSHVQLTEALEDMANPAQRQGGGFGHQGLGEMSDRTRAMMDVLDHLQDLWSEPVDSESGWNDTVNKLNGLHALMEWNAEALKETRAAFCALSDEQGRAAITEALSGDEWTTPSVPPGSRPSAPPESISDLFKEPEMLWRPSSTRDHVASTLLSFPSPGDDLSALKVSGGPLVFGDDTPDDGGYDGDDHGRTEADDNHSARPTVSVDAWATTASALAKAESARKAEVEAGVGIEAIGLDAAAKGGERQVDRPEPLVVDVPDFNNDPENNGDGEKEHLGRGNDDSKLEAVDRAIFRDLATVMAMKELKYKQ